MLAHSLPAFLLSTLTLTPVYATEREAANLDDFGTAIMVNLFIIAVYALYWIKQKA